MTLARSSRSRSPTWKNQPPCLKPSSPVGSWTTPSSETFSLITILPISVLLLLRLDLVREAEARKQLGIEEGGALGDPPAFERQHGEAARQEALPLLVPAVVPERQLPVRPRRHEAPAVSARQHMDV